MAEIDRGGSRSPPHVWQASQTSCLLGLRSIPQQGLNEIDEIIDYLEHFFEYIAKIRKYLVFLECWLG